MTSRKYDMPCFLILKIQYLIVKLWCVNMNAIHNITVQDKKKMQILTGVSEIGDEGVKRPAGIDITRRG